MQDGLYLFGKWVGEVDYAVTKQANDLSSPTTLQANRTNMFTMPDTSAIRKLLQNAEQLDSAGKDPYRLIPAKLIDDGEVVFSGNATLQSFQGGWKVLLVGPQKGLFDQLADTKLSDLDLSQYDHKWSLDNAATYVGAESGILYPLIDYGSLDGSIFAQDTITPAIYASTLISAMLKRFGYRPKGNWLTDPLLKRIFLPFTNDLPKIHDQEWIDDRTARVAVPDNPSPIELKNGHPIDIVLPLTVDFLPLDGFVDGRKDAYKAEQFKYLCQESGRFKVQGAISFVYIVRFGTPEMKLQVIKNGQPVGEGVYWSEAGYVDRLDYPETISFSDTITCKAGDELQIRLTGNARTDIASYGVYISRMLGEMYASFMPDATVHQDDVWPIAANLPDLTCADLLKSVALMCSGTFNIDEAARTLELKLLDGVIDNVANATDLSSCIEEGVEPENNVILSPYCQKNLLKWKPLEDKTLAGYGDGVITCSAQNIPLETPLFELPFSASVDSQNNIPGYGFAVLVETRTVTGSGANLQVNTKSTTPRLLLAEPSKPVWVTVNKVNEDLTTVKVRIQLTGCWWSQRQQSIMTENNSFCLAFDRPAGQTNREQTLSQRYFNGLRRVLRRPRQLTVSAYLRPAQLATLDLYAPIRLQKVRAGSLDINDNFFYINQVQNWRPGLPCSLILVAY